MEDQTPGDPLQQQLERLAERIDALAGRVDRLEAVRGVQAQAAAPAPPPPIIPPQPAVPAAPRIPEPPAAPAAGPSPAFRPLPPPQPLPRPPQSAPFDWEQLIGGKWALWLGSIASFFAVALFLGYTWHYLSQPQRLLAGYGTGALFLAAGALASGRGQKWFSEGLSGAGLAMLYLSTWAGAVRYGLMGANAAFVLMALITAAGVLLSVRSDAVSLCVLATLGGFLTPAVLTTAGRGASSAAPLLIYVAVLNAGVVAVSLFKRWRGVVLLSFVATILLTGGWALESYTEPQRWLVFGFFTLYFLMFLGAACFHSMLRKQQTAPEDLLLLFSDTFVYLAAGLALLYDGLGNYPGLFPAALGVFLLVFAWDTLSSAPDNHSLRRSLVGIGLLCLTVAIPVQMRQGWIGVCWTIEAAVLASLARQLNSPTLRRASQVVWLLGWLAVLVVVASVEPARHVVLVNERALPVLAAALSGAWMFLVARREDGIGRDGLADLYGVAAVLGGATLAPMETWYALSWRDYLLPEAVSVRTLYMTACLWAVYSVAVWKAGAALSSVAVRLTAVTLAVLAAVLPAMATTSGYGAKWQPFWNARWLSFVLVAAMLALLAWMVRREQESLAGEEAGAAGFLPALVSLVALWALTVEVYSGARVWQIARPLPSDAAALLAVSMFWAVYAPVLCALGIAWKLESLRAVGYFAGFVALILALTTSATAVSPALSPVANLRFLALVVLTGSALSLALVIARGEKAKGASSGEPGAIGILAAVVLLWGLTQETYEFFRYTQARWGEHWKVAAQMGVSLVWTMSGVLFLVGGVIRRFRPVRLFALLLLGLTALKVFFADLSFLDTPYRILSFAGLGVALIGISWLYSRYEIGGGGTGEQQPPNV